MSKIHDIAELMRSRILTAPLASELPTLVDLTELYQANEDPALEVDAVIVNRQKEIQSKVSLVQAKARGTAIVIQWDGHAPDQKNAGSPKMAYTYSVQVWSKPVLGEGDFPADDVFESIVARLWHWEPGVAEAGKGIAHREVQVMPGGVIPNKTYMIYEFGLLVPVSL
jgi:hypothetical protein